MVGGAVEEAVDEHDVHDVVPDVPLALDLLPLLRRERQQCAHVEHNFVALEHCVDGLLARRAVCAMFRLESERNDQSERVTARVCLVCEWRD